jgi:dinuclear metal center YbgI/SA1388 family protein
MTTKVGEVCQHLDREFPAHLSEDWDNTGLLIGRHRADVGRLMTCLTITEASALEAIERGADLIVTHHPLPFRPSKRITDDTRTGKLLLDLIENKIAVYSPHTSFDSAARGINQRLAEGLGLASIAPLRPHSDDASVGSGRYGELEPAIDLRTLEQRVMNLLGIVTTRTVGKPTATIRRVAVACGSAGEFLADADQLDCQAFVTGEATFHTCLEAEARNLALLLPGHYASERFALEQLAEELQAAYADIKVWASVAEADPIGPPVERETPM